VESVKWLLNLQPSKINIFVCFIEQMKSHTVDVVKSTKDDRSMIYDNMQKLSKFSLSVDIIYCRRNTKYCNFIKEEQIIVLTTKPIKL
jgi:coproporphyrinogen III oxidase-like Fe-S oxidoreductase